MGHDANAQALLETMPAEKFNARPNRSLDSPILAVLGEASLLVGRADEAQWFAQHALEIAREFGQQEVESTALRLIGDLLTRRHWTRTGRRWRLPGNSGCGLSSRIATSASAKFAAALAASLRRPNTSQPQ
jgi:hypothetical protein